MPIQIASPELNSTPTLPPLEKSGVRTGLRITTWNCARKSREKILPAVAALDADFAFLQEIARPATASPNELWIGTNPKQGVSVISHSGARIRLAKEYDEKLRYALPVEVDGDRPLQLLAIWAMKEPEHYVPNLVAILEHYRAFIQRGPTIVAGDFNANPAFDKVHPRFLFNTITDKFEKLGLLSAYHSKVGEAHGHESKSTLYHLHKQERPFHIDYLFYPKSWRAALSEVAVGSYEAYKGLSDHRPLSAMFTHEICAT